MSLPYIVLQYNDLQQLNFIQQGSTRLRVACFDLCPSLIVLGANSGTIYILDHDTLKLKHQIPTGNGSVVQLSISPDESHVAYALSNGFVEVFEILGQDGSGCRHLIGSRDHEGQIVSSIVWSLNSMEVYVGDTLGKVSALYVPKSRTASLFRSSNVHLMTLDSAVSQLDYCDGHLLVSTLDRSYICNTSLETFAQIGTKLRKGEFGGCFCRVSFVSSVTPSSQENKPSQTELEESLEINQKGNFDPLDSGKFELSDCHEVMENEEKGQQSPEKSAGQLQQGIATRVFCARPGSRVWEGDLTGKVLVTHQLKKALMVPPIEVLLTDGSYGDMELLREDVQKRKDSARSSKEASNSESENITSPSSRDDKSQSHPPVGVAFTKMLNFYNSFLLAVSCYGLYIIDPSNSTLLLWVSEPDGIMDIKVSGNTLIYKTGRGSIQNFMITTVDVAVLVLHNRSLMIECARLCLQHQELFYSSKLLRRLGTKILSDLAGQIVDEVVKEELRNMEKLLSESCDKENQEVNPKKSGITYVRNENYNSSEIKEGLHFALKLGHHAFLPTSVTRWYSEPHLCYDHNFTVEQRSAISVETSPIHDFRGNRLISSTSSFLQDLQSSLSLARYSSEDTLQSISGSKSHSGLGSYSDGKKSNSPDLYHRSVSSPTHSSGRWSQQSDKSHKSLESSQEMYEDPLFPPSDSSPDLELATRTFLDGQKQQYGHTDSHAFYSLPYAPINPTSETAAIVQDLMENAATNVVSTITLGTKSLKEKLRNVAQLKASSEMSPLRTMRGPFSVLDLIGNSSVADQDDRFHSSTSGTDETDGFDTDIVIKTKPKRKGHRKGVLTSPSLSRSSTLPDTEDLLHSSIVELPGVVRNLHELVMSTMKQITNSEDQQETKGLLTHWFEVYCSTVQEIQSNKSSPQSVEEPLDGPVSISSVDSVGSTATSCDSLKWDCNDIGFEPSAMSADILEQITRMFLHCLQFKVHTAGTNSHTGCDFNRFDVSQHPLTPDDIKKLDLLYAQLISNDCGLLHYATLLNALDTLGQNYYILTWIALLEKVTKDSEVVSTYPLPDIISDLDFTRSQRVSFLYKLASGGNLKNLTVAATQIQNPLVIFDVIFMINFTLTRPSENTPTNQGHTLRHYLFQFLNEIAQDKDIRELYLTYWSWCPELQYDILNALFSVFNAATTTCDCGMPLPRNTRMPLESLVETIFAHHVLDPKNISQLCQNSGYWKGYCILSLAYKLHPLIESFPYVLQKGDLDLINGAIESMDENDIPHTLKALVAITCTNKAMIRCYKCHTMINLDSKIQKEAEVKPDENFVFNFRVNGEPPYKGLNLEEISDNKEGDHLDDETDTLQDSSPKRSESSSPSQDVQCSTGSKDVLDVGQLWEAVVVQILRKVKATEALKLLQEVQNEIPPGTIPQKLYSWCILLSLVEHRGPTARWALLDSLTDTSIKPYSRKVAEALYRLEPSLKRRDSTSGTFINTRELIEDSSESPSTQSPPFLPLGHHWGVRSQILQGICHFCQLRLPEEALVNVGGVTVFSCSHAYHAICMVQRGHFCIACAKQESLKSRVA